MPKMAPGMSAELLTACAQAQADVYRDEVPGSVLTENIDGMQVAAIPCSLDVGKLMIVAVRGTDEVVDLPPNIPVSGDLERVQTFAGLVDRAKKLAQFAAGLGRYRPLVFTGHSQGGALAALAPVADRDLDVHAMIAFGAPKFAGLYYPFPNRLWRVTRRLDLVTYLPCCTGWRTHGRELLFGMDHQPMERSWSESVTRRLEWATQLDFINLASLSQDTFMLWGQNAWEKVRYWHSADEYRHCRFGEVRLY